MSAGVGNAWGSAIATGFAGSGFGAMAAVGVAKARDALDGGGLPGAVGAKDAEDLAGRHGKGHIRDGHFLAIRLPEVMHLHCGAGHGCLLEWLTRGETEGLHAGKAKPHSNAPRGAAGP